MVPDLGNLELRAGRRCKCRRPAGKLQLAGENLSDQRLRRWIVRLEYHQSVFAENSIEKPRERGPRADTI